MGVRGRRNDVVVPAERKPAKMRDMATNSFFFISRVSGEEVMTEIVSGV